MPMESIETFTIKNPEMPPENLGDKFCRLDINIYRMKPVRLQ